MSDVVTLSLRNDPTLLIWLPFENGLDVRGLPNRLCVCVLFLCDSCRFFLTCVFPSTLPHQGRLATPTIVSMSATTLSVFPRWCFQGSRKEGGTGNSGPFPSWGNVSFPPLHMSDKSNGTLGWKPSTPTPVVLLHAASALITAHTLCGAKASSCFLSSRLSHGFSCS